MDKSTVSAYINTLLWSETLSTGEEGEPLVVDGEEYADGTSLDDLPIFDDTPGFPALVKQATEDLEGFQAYCLGTIGIDPFRFFDPEQVATDFCLSRNGHGAGFFDGSYCLKVVGPHSTPESAQGVDLADDLQAAAKTFGTHGLMAYLNNENKLTIESHG